MNPFTFLQELIGMLRMPEIGISQILDIIIMAGLLYYILRWIRQTHAWALLKGIVIVVFVAMVAYLFDLVTVRWLMENALAMGLIALVILFQPELRKALEQLGRGMDLSGLTDNRGQKRGMQNQVIIEITQGVFTMAAKRTGALICIERGVKLDDIIKTGIVIDAAISRQLLINIFADKTPLHDGAVVINQSRVVAAACILPLTAENVDYELGTRHRAAIGLSEISDSLIIVVSEETGTISVAFEGKLRRNVTEASLRSMLNDEMSEVTKRRLIPWKNRRKS